LRRSKNNRIIAGVCGGLAEFFGISSFWFRLALIIAFIPGGVPGILIYLILWIIIPGE
jgi:phage shock protein PspC (stress-responsive transcriptional regulator)